MTRSEFMQAVRSSILSKYEDQLSALCRNAICIEYDFSGDEPEVGRSRIGGLPDLPIDVKWPEWQNVPLAFIAQFRMSDLTEDDTDNMLPSKGMLYFFYDVEQPWGYNPDDFGRWRVIYYEDDSLTLNRTQAPNGLPEAGIYQPHSLKFSHADSFPDWMTFDIENLDMDKEEMSIYQDLMYEIVNSTTLDYSSERLLGHPDVIQNDMQWECQMVSNGIYCGDGSYDTDPRYAELVPGSSEWQLLLQLSSSGDEDMMWGDEGKLYFWIKKDDLKSLDFEKVWVILQCT